MVSINDLYLGGRVRVGRGCSQHPMLSTKPSTGRAICKKCGEKIEKGTTQLSCSFKGFFGQKEIHFHLSCIIKEGRSFMSESEAASLLSIGSWRTMVGDNNGI